jgi:glucose/arabinose dehydrogenase
MDGRQLSTLKTQQWQGFHLPTSVVFDPTGHLYIAQSGLPLGGEPPGGSVWRIAPDGERLCIATDLRPPVNGLSVDKTRLYVAEGGNPGRISVIDLVSFERQTVLDDLPGGGNYHTNMAIMGDDGWLYFGQGAMTNSGIVGPDAEMVSWLRQCPHPCDIAGCDVVLSGWNADVIGADADVSDKPFTTGAFQPFDTNTFDGQKITGQLPCTSAVMRCKPDGSALELVAWGLRNPYGLGFDRSGRLLAIDLGINDRGSRGVGNVPDCLYEVKQGQWYGWPDYAGGRAVNLDDLLPQRGERPHLLLQNHDELGPVAQPLFSFSPHCAPTKFTLVPGSDDLIITLFGDKLPMTGPAGERCGREVVRLNPHTGACSVLVGHQFHRPIDVAFDAQGVLYVLDFGHFELNADTSVAVTPFGGTLKRISSPVFVAVDRCYPLPIPQPQSQAENGKGWLASDITYCSNVHAGESVAEIIANFGQFIQPVCQGRGLESMACGLWISARAASELQNDSVLDSFERALGLFGLQLTSINGFPFGGFHQDAVKDQVYLPDWSDPARLQYSKNLADVLAKCLPYDVDNGAISTLPLGYKKHWSEAKQQAAIAHLNELMVYLKALKVRTGKHIQVCLEMEPDCVLESTDELIDFFIHQRFVEDELANNHLAVCYDVCHQAVMFEDGFDALQRICGAGITIGKIQLSSALNAQFNQAQNSAEDDGLLELLSQFCEPKYLHQVKYQNAQGQLNASADLSVALKDNTPKTQWRVHFHVPINTEHLVHPQLKTTRDDLLRVFDFLREYPAIKPILEVETYSWQVLPAQIRPQNDGQLIDGIVNELRWVETQLQQRGLLIK